MFQLETILQKNWGLHNYTDCSGLLEIMAAKLLQITTKFYYKLRELIYYKLCQVYFKLRQLLQIATFITNYDVAIGSCAASALKFIDKVRLYGFRNMIFKSKIFLESVTFLKNALSLQNFKRLLIHLLSLFLLVLEIFPKYGNTILSSSFGTVVKTCF